MAYNTRYYLGKGGEKTIKGAIVYTILNWPVKWYLQVVFFFLSAYRCYMNRGNPQFIIFRVH